MKNIICKNKFLVFNDDKKILLFLEEKNNKSKFFLPTIYTSKDEIVNSISPKILELININFENVELINDFHDEYFSYKKKNGKFELTKIVREKKYYVAYHIFTKDEYDSIYQICSTENIIPYMVNLEELEYIMSLKRKKSADMDLYIGHTARVLQKKINFEEYNLKERKYDRYKI